MDKFRRGQVEIIVIIPILLCVILLDSAMMEFFEGEMSKLKNLKGAFEEIVSGFNYFIDPISGNAYPCRGNITPPLEGVFR